MVSKNLKTSVFCLLICFISQQGFAQMPNSKKVDLPAIYTFDYNYKLKMTSQSQKEDMVMEYFLKKDAEYFGFKMDQMKTEQGNMFFVMDSKLNTNAMFMDMMGQKMVQTSSLNMKEMANDASESNKNFNIKKIDRKTIMGYDCQGFLIDNDESEITFYLAENAPLSFNNMWNANNKNLPKGFNAKWMEQMENGLMMEMIYKDKKKSKNNMTMTCIELKKTDFSIKTSDYKSGMFGG